MEKRFIKFSLVGVICFLVLISIIGIVVIVASINNSRDEDENSNYEKVNEINKDDFVKEKDRVAEENVEKKEVTEYKSTIVINGEEQEIEFKIYKSDFGYKMAYDVGSFYVEHGDIDEYKSLYTDTISLSASKESGEFVGKTEELIQGAEANRRKNDTYVLSQMDVNGKLCLREEFVDGLGVTNMSYYIEGKDSKEYFIIKGSCGKELKESTVMIVEEMVKTFIVV